MENKKLKLLVLSFFFAVSPVFAMLDESNESSKSPKSPRVAKTSSSSNSSASILLKTDSAEIKEKPTGHRRSHRDQLAPPSERTVSPTRQRNGLTEDKKISPHEAILSEEEINTNKSKGNPSKRHSSSRPSSGRQDTKSTTDKRGSSHWEKDSSGHEAILSQGEIMPNQSNRKPSKEKNSATSPRREQQESATEEKASSGRESNFLQENGKGESPQNNLEVPEPEHKEPFQNRPPLSPEKTDLSPITPLSDRDRVKIWYPVNKKDAIIYAYYFSFRSVMTEYFEENELGVPSSIAVDPSQTNVHNQIFRLGENSNSDHYNKSAVLLKDYIERDKKFLKLMNDKEKNKINNKYIVVDVFTAIPQSLGFWDAAKFYETHIPEYVHEIPLKKDSASLVPIFLEKNEFDSLKDNILSSNLTNLTQKSLAEPLPEALSALKTEFISAFPEIPKQDSPLGLNAESRQNSTRIPENAHIPKSHSSSSGDSLLSSRAKKERL